MGRAWIWDNTEDKKQHLQWLVFRVGSGTIVCVTDGLYGQKTTPNVSDLGILLCCTKAKYMLHVNFYKDPRTASSHQEELLGLVAIHTILLVLC